MFQFTSKLDFHVLLNAQGHLRTRPTGEKGIKVSIVGVRAVSVSDLSIWNCLSFLCVKHCHYTLSEGIYGPSFPPTNQTSPLWLALTIFFSHFFRSWLHFGFLPHLSCKHGTVWLFLCFILIPCGKCGSPYVGKAAPAARVTLYPFPQACAVFSRVQPMVWPPMSEIFNAHADVDACDLHTGAVRTP